MRGNARLEKQLYVQTLVGSFTCAARLAVQVFLGLWSCMLACQCSGSGLHMPGCLLMRAD